MKALVLTYDKNRPLTNFMIHMYQKLWPNHPFHFYIPYQHLNKREYQNTTFIESKPNIKQTILTLVAQAKPEEWVYWCIDDKFPLKVDVQQVNKLVTLLQSGHFSEEAGILFCHKSGTLYSSSRNNENPKLLHTLKFQMRKTLKPFWIHQFIKAKVLKKIVEQFPDDIPYAKIMDEYLKSITMPSNERLWVTADNYALFGESSVKGKLTNTFVECVKKENLKVPDIPISNEVGKVYGKAPSKLHVFHEIIAKRFQG